MWVGSALGPLPLYLITVRPGKPYVCPVVRKIGSRELLTVIPVSEMKPVGSRDLIIAGGSRRPSFAGLRILSDPR
jgi:hypothetical protein